MINEITVADLSVEDSIYLASRRDLAERRRNGVFYTPEPLTSLLSRWAIRNRDQLVLEPSFGGCGFLVAVRDRLVELENDHPQRNLYGCDIDNDAFDILGKLFRNNGLEGHFLKQDFLIVDPSQLPPVDVVIGNPPYISWHNMSLSQRRTASLIASKYGLTGKASLWMHFILQSLSFIKPGGRMAWILPGSFVFSDYSVQLRKVLTHFFGRALAVYLEQRVFIETGTEESSVVLLCEDFNALSTEQLRFTSVKDLDNLKEAIDTWSSGLPYGEPLNGRPQFAMVSPSLYQTYADVLTNGSSYKIGDIANVKIGLVTGANRFFVLNQETADKLGLSSQFIRPILAKFNQIKGLDLTIEDLENLRKEQHRCLLLSCSKKSHLPDSLRAYLDTFSKEDREKNYTFKKTRAVWYDIDDGDRPDGFFSAMQSEGPFLVLNSAGTTCTNTIYKVTFKVDTSQERKKAIAIAVQSSFTQFSAELEGRSHGGGALKLEPSEVKRLSILVPDDLTGITDAFDEVNYYLRDGDRAAARDIADQFLIDHNVITTAELAAMQEGVRILRSIRNGHRNR